MGSAYAIICTQSQYRPSSGTRHGVRWHGPCYSRSSPPIHRHLSSPRHPSRTSPQRCSRSASKGSGQLVSYHLRKPGLLHHTCKERRYRRLHYPSRGCGTDVKPGEVLRPGDERVGWEIAHLPGMGAYALNSYRIFYRDRLRAVDDEDGIEAEWKRVVPMGKELKPYLKWRWEKELANG
jgi:hypothetical protein